jgi:hypothetical protein
MGFRSGGPELGFCQVPKDLGVGVELLASMLFPENEGGDVEVERIRRRRRRRRRKWRRFKWVVMVVEEIEVERVGEEGARPGEGKEAELSVVEAGGEVGVAGDGRRLWRRVAGIVIAGGW